MKKFVLISLLMLSACGTLFSGTEQDIRFDANVKETRIFIDGTEVCKTPCVYPLEKNRAAPLSSPRKKAMMTNKLYLNHILTTYPFSILSSGQPG